MPMFRKNIRMRRYRAEIMLASCTLIWGGTFVAIELSLERTSAMLLVSIRFGLAAILFFVFFIRRVCKMNRRVLFQGIGLGLAMTLAFSLQTAGLEFTTVTRSAFITQMLVFFTPLLQWSWIGRRPGWRILPAALVVFCGMYLLLFPTANDPLNLGDWLSLGCAFSFSLYIILLDRIDPQTDRVALIFIQCITIAMISGTYAILFEDIRWQPDLNFYLSMLYLAPLGVNLVIYWHTRYQPLSTPARAAIIFSLEPVFASVGALLFLGKVFSWNMGLGALFIITGVLIAEWPGHKKIVNEEIKN